MKNDLNLKSNQSINHQNSPKRACCDISNDITFLTCVLVVNIYRYLSRFKVYLVRWAKI